MIEISGKYTSAKIYTDIVEEGAIAQITEVCNQPFAEGCRIAIMPDVHEGNGCTIGTAMQVKDKIVPAMVGVDISCGVYVQEILNEDINFREVDTAIREFVPSGFKSRETIHPMAKDFQIEKLRCADKFEKLGKSLYQLGSLGGGNHMIEIDKSSDGKHYLVIHSGSRNIGKRVAEHYQKLAEDTLYGHEAEYLAKAREEVKARCKAEGRARDIGRELAALKRTIYNKDLCYLEGENMKDYMHDATIMTLYSDLNRRIMAHEIFNNTSLEMGKENFTTLHNYVDGLHRILRKGAISAQEREKVIIPLNMRDGSIIAVGKGNPDWNFSAPHGAGRVMGRREAKKTFKMEDFEKAMRGIYTTSVTKDTIDEAPFVYKPMEQILNNIGDTVDVLEVIKPVYNFKASEV